MRTFNSMPFLRILLPFCSGILISIYLSLSVPFFVPLAIIIICLALHLILRPGRSKIIGMVLADIFFMVFGAYLINFTDLSRSESYYGKYTSAESFVKMVAVINDLPVQKEKTVKCFLTVKEIDDKGQFKKASGNVIAYFKRSSLSASLAAGHTVYLKARLREVERPLNPGEFNYRAYLSNKQIYHTLFVDSASYVVVGDQQLLNPVWALGLRCKAFLLNGLKQSPLIPDAYAICAALLTGYDDDIEKPVMEAFSHSGTLHVLSVSGLHTGLIYLGLNFLLNLVDRKNRHKVIRFVIVTFCLWGFALITGFCAPVLRAVIMFNLLGLGKLYFRYNYRNQLNILFVSAFLLLVYNPWLILDVGFLLSYFAMIGLLYYQPKFALMYNPSNAAIRYCWLSFTASVAATLSTLPITLFFFKQFPLWFVICNLVVVPATFLLLILALFVVLKISLVAHVINLIVKALIIFIGLFNTRNTGYLDHLHFDFADAIFLSAIIILLTNAISSRSYRSLSMSCILLISWQFLSILQVMVIKNESFFAVYHINRSSAVGVKNRTHLHLFQPDQQTFNFHIKPHVTSLNYPEIQLKKFNYVSTGQQSILILQKNRIATSFDPASIKTLVVTDNVDLLKEEFAVFTNLQQVVVDGSNNNNTRELTRQICRNFNLEFYDTKMGGAFLLPLR